MSREISGKELAEFDCDDDIAQFLIMMCKKKRKGKSNIIYGHFHHSSDIIESERERACS